jgi:hypothetical protein
VTKTETTPSEWSELARFGRTAAVFTTLGLILYGGLYAASEELVTRYAQRNRFFMVKTAPHLTYDYVILGASHAAVLDYRDMNSRLEGLTGARILNLSIQGAGIAVNRLVLDYFLVDHHADTVVYILDSFGFYSPEWNEDRLRDTSLLQRAPFDLALLRLLLSNPATRGVARDYALGFTKINNTDRFEPDLFEEEATRFDRTYRPVAQIDRQRVSYLYPESVHDASFQDSPYLAQFEDLIGDVEARGIGLIVVRPPIPARMYDMIPNETRFDDMLAALLDDHGVELHNLALVNNDESYFFDSDHLNETGVLSFYENYFVPLLRQEVGGRR